MRLTTPRLPPSLWSGRASSRAFILIDHRLISFIKTELGDKTSKRQTRIALDGGRSSLLQPTRREPLSTKKDVYFATTSGNDQRDGEKCTQRAPHPSPEGNRQKNEEGI